LIPGLPVRPGFITSYVISYKNAGTVAHTGEVLFKPDPRMTYESSSPSYTDITADTLRFAISNLQPLSSGIIELRYRVAAPPTVNNGDTITSLALFTTVGDITPSDDTSILKQRVIGSYDPNDKTENNGGIVGSDYVSEGKYFNYRIRFQNTGTDTAFTVIIRDTLDNKLDWSTFEMVSASHPYTVSINNDNKLEWTFSNINLPDSNINEPLSHGYIAYRVKPKSTVVVGDQINNLASIYFDYNLPVATNNALTLVQDNFTPLPIQLINFTGQLSNNTVQLNWKADQGKDFEKFEIERSLDGKIYNRIETVPFNNSISNYHLLDNISALPSKLIFYRLKMIDADSKFNYSKVIVFRINPVQNNFTIYPNPARTEIFVSLTADKKQNLRVKVLDASGRILSEHQKEVQKGTNVFPVNTFGLKAGNYILQMILNGETKASKFAIIN
ncbi:MAG: T9SS type A sorting domain-containing protein, partial [Flavisolibacter sp.]|nr:T9SS type A sorting domain-containing protein [Flavisolibacter sp.]